MAAHCCPRCGSCWPAGVLRASSKVMGSVWLCPVDGCETKYQASSNPLSESAAKHKIHEKLYEALEADRKARNEPSQEELESREFRAAIDEILGLPEAA